MMEYVLRLFRVMPDGSERELRFRGETRYAALKAFVAWATPRMGDAWEPPADDAGDQELWFTPIQAALSRPRSIIELSYKDASEDLGDPQRHTMPLRWLVSVAGRDWVLEKVQSFAEDQVEACLREFISYLLDDEDSLAWRG